MRHVLIWLLISSFAAVAHTQQRIPTEQRQLRVHVVDSHGGVRAKVDLRSANMSDFSTQTDGMGIANFNGVPAGDYILIVSVGGKEVYRDQLSLTHAEAFRSELVRLPSAEMNGQPVIALGELNIPKTANDHYMAGIRAIAVRDWENGLRALKKTIKVYPRHARAHNAMGVVFAIKTQFREAASAFRRAIDANPSFAEPHFNLGKLLLESNRAPEARIELERNFELDGRNPSALALLIEAMILTHDEESAVSLMHSVHLRNIQHAAILHLQIASALEMHSRLELAAEQYLLVLHESSSESEVREAKLSLSRMKTPPVR